MFKEGVKIFCKIDGIDIPLVSTGTSPFIGAGQFGYKAFEWRRKFLNNPDAMFEILEAGYKNGVRGIEAIPAGKILEAAYKMKETYNDYVIIGSTYPGDDPKIDSLADIGAKLIFVHGMVSDSRDFNLVKLIDEISSLGILAGIATHNPIPTIKFCINNSLKVRFFLIPFNAKGFLMGNKLQLEKIVDSTKDHFFIGMKTLAAGNIKPEVAFKYIADHNICALTIGMVNNQQAAESSTVALKTLINKQNRNLK
jgi:hypothetical protein